MKCRTAGTTVLWLGLGVILLVPSAPGSGQVAPAFPGDSAAALASWSYPLVRERIGEAGIAVGPWRVGGPRVYVSGGAGYNRHWIAFEHEPSSDRFRPVHSSVSYPDRIRFLGLGRLSGEAAQILVVLADGRVFVHRESDYRLVEAFEVVAAPRGVEVADVDRDGRDELVVTNEDGLHVYSGRHLDWSAPTPDISWGVAVGQLDADRAIEIAVSKGAVYDADLEALEWTFEAGLGISIAVGDIDSDRRDEMVVGVSQQELAAFDGRSPEPVWVLNVGYRRGHLADGTGDGVPELVVPEYGGFTVYDVVTLESVWSRIPGSGYPWSFLVADVDADGESELLFGTGGYQPRLHAYDWLGQGPPKWRSDPLYFGFHSPRIGDLDGGSEELVAATSEYNSGTGRALVFDSRSRKLLGMSPPFFALEPDGAGRGPFDVELFDLDGDGQQEILLAGGGLYGRGRVVAVRFDEGEFTTTWWNEPTSSSPFYAVAAGDVDGDGDVEVVAGNNRSSSGDTLGVFAYDLASGAEEWSALDLPEPPNALPPRITELEILDLDGDGALEIVTLMFRRGAHILSAADGEVLDTIGGEFRSLGILAAAIPGVDESDTPKLVYGDDDGVLRVYRFTSGALELLRTDQVSYAVDGITVLQSSGGEADRRGPWLLLSGGGQLRLVVMAPQGLYEVWTSEDYDLVEKGILSCAPHPRWFASGTHSVEEFEFRGGRLPLGRLFCGAP